MIPPRPYSPRRPLPAHVARRLQVVVKTLRAELLTWQEGFAVRDEKGVWHFDPACPDTGLAAVHACKLESAIKFLEGLIEKGVSEHP